MPETKPVELRPMNRLLGLAMQAQLHGRYDEETTLRSEVVLGQLRRFLRSKRPIAPEHAHLAYAIIDEAIAAGDQR